MLVIGEEAILKGEIKNCREIEIYGYVEGLLEADKVTVHPEGRLFGTVKADTADVHGQVQGNVRIKQLIAIWRTGSVAGNVKYGRLAMEEGADLSATVRNVPPSIAGDLDLAVARGRAVRITTADLTAIDPDDTVHSLTFSVSNASNGFVALTSSPAVAVNSFTQADLEAGHVLFAHNGATSDTARFDVIVADRAGATSGAPQTVNVAVRA